MNTKGVTLVEIMMVLAVSALIIMGAVIYYQSNKLTATTTRIVGDMNSIVGAYKAYVAGGNVIQGPAGIPMSTLKENGLLPDSFNDPWGQSYVTMACAPQGGTEIAIQIVSLSWGDKTCNAVASAVQGSARRLGQFDCIDNSQDTACGFVYEF